MKYLKTYENFNIREIYVQIYGEPQSEEDFQFMNSWITNFDEFSSLNQSGEFINRLKTLENIDVEDNSDKLKKSWIAKNGVPKTREQKEMMMFYIRNMIDREPSVNYLGDETNQIL